MERAFRLADAAGLARGRKSRNPLHLGTRLATSDTPYTRPAAGVNGGGKQDTAHFERLRGSIHGRR